MEQPCKVGQFWRGADGGLNFTISSIDSPAAYFVFRKKLAKHFKLIPIGPTTYPLDALTKAYLSLPSLAVIRLEWDVWNGFFVSTASFRAEKALYQIARFCESDLS